MGVGAVVSAHVKPELIEVIWLGSAPKGCYTKLDGPALMPPAAAGEEVHELAKKDVLGPPKKGAFAPF